MKNTIVTLVVALLLGCSSTPNLSSEAYVVSAENLSEHWEMKSK